MASSLVLVAGLCMAIQIFSGLADERMNLTIDCGVLTPTRTDFLGLNWVGDGAYIKTGKTAKVQGTGSILQEHMTLRYFPSQRKSCYVIPGVALGRKHMIRATFFYGNYDGKSSPPSFHLQFDGNHWVTVETSSTMAYYWEVIYAPKRDMISVCVAQTSPGHIPFVSSLEVKEFESGMYETKGTEDVLLKWSRRAFGAKDFVRYPDDPYDRYWHPRSSTVTDGVIIVARDDMSSVQNLTDRDIPGAALANAITPWSSTATNLTVPLSEMNLEDGIYYYTFYFSEVSLAAYENRSRSFNFLVDGTKRNDDPIIPSYKSYSTDYNHGRNLTAGSVISLVNTPDATLPPILNAMELFQVISHTLATGTNENDVKALETLQGRYQQLQSWAGDPCLPIGFAWDWLNCNANDLPQVTELHLSGSGLSGTLPDFSNLTALEIIDLSNNSLSGHVPEFLGTFPYLKELNLADNSFTGLLPAALVGNKNLKLNTQGNNIIEDKQGNNITEDKPNPSFSSGEGNMTPVMVGISISSIVMFLLLV